MESYKVKTVEEEIEEGHQRDDIFCSLKGVGVAELVLGITMLCLSIASTIGAEVYRGPGIGLSRVGDGIWCNIFSIAAGIMAIVTSQKVTSFTVCWSMILSIIGSVFMVILVFIELLAAVQGLDWAWGLLILHSVTLILGLAELTLCIYSSVVFGRLFKKCPYRAYGRNHDLCSPCCAYNGEHTNFAHVMYTTVNSKRHDA